MNDFIDIKDYTQLYMNKKSFPSFYGIIFLMIVIISLGFLKIDRYYELEGYVLEDLVVVNVDLDQLSKLNQNNILYIENRKYEYSIYDYEEEIMEYNMHFYKRVRIQINLDEKWNYDYNIIKIKFQIDKKTIFGLAFEKMKGEL